MHKRKNIQIEDNTNHPLLFTPEVSFTDGGISWIEENGNRIISKDFVGYAFKIDKHVLCSVDLSGNFMLYSDNVDNPILTIKETKKILNKLFDMGIIRDSTLDPFPEFERGKNPRFQISGATFINDYILTDMTYVDDEFVADDNIISLE